MATVLTVGITSGIPSSGTGTVSTIDNMLGTAGSPSANYLSIQSTVAIPVSPNVSTSNATSLFTVITSDGNNSTNVKASGAVVYGVHLYNNSMVPAFFKIYNLSSAPTVGSSTFIFNVGVSPGAARDVALAGAKSTTGLGYTITAGVTSTSTGAIFADDISGIIEYI